MNKELLRELIEDAAEREAVYGFLSSLLLLELTEEQVERFRTQDLVSLKGHNGAIDSGLDKMSSYFRSESGRDMRQELAADYAHSVLGVTADQRQMAMPYESLFTGTSGLLMGDARDDVYRIYCQEHVGTQEGRDIPEDHLGLIFEFMALLCRRYAAALQEGEYHEALRLLSVQDEVVSRHVENWVNSFCDTLADVARTDFYRGLSDVVRGWVVIDGEALENTLADMEDEVCLAGVAI